VIRKTNLERKKKKRFFINLQRCRKCQEQPYDRAQAQGRAVFFPNHIFRHIKDSHRTDGFGYTISNQQLPWKVTGRFSRSRTCFGGSGFSNCGQPDFHVSYVSCLPAYFRSPFLGLNYYGCRACFSFYISLLNLDNYSHLCRTPSSVYL
jgi:hypothetical protein